MLSGEQFLTEVSKWTGAKERGGTAGGASTFVIITTGVAPIC